ncbi:MAG TPA: AsmA-like C-terminal region-containing protein [Kiritimatiellia bacterium]|nr:AsmA-like C-terminal region-containing protein [Kiritimatiellia bacterium]HRZ11869.1 AsmA-like C-terminal region-containing protein [Kiritimatiellia bacterium]HSA17325.1 AsmA-like C-terminal region-containing protein [Kiritimatiellia bacterium]
MEPMLQTPPAAPPSPDARASRKRPAFLFRAGRRLLRFLAGFAGLVLVVSAALLLYCSAAGFPAWLVKRVLARLEEQGVHARVRRARLSVMDGIVLKGFRLYDDPAAAAPVIEADRFALGLNALEWLSRRHGIVGLRIRGARLRLYLEARDDPNLSEQVVLENLHAAIRFRPGAVEMERLYAEGLGMQFRGAGTIHRRLPEKETGRSGADLLRRCPDWLFKALEQVRALQFSQPPQVRLDFALELDDPAESRVELKIQSRRTQTPVGLFDRWSVDAALDGSRMMLKSLILRQGAARLNLNGALSLANRKAEFRLFSDLPLKQWMAILPRAWRLRLEQMGYELKGEASLELWGGPAPWSEIKQHLGGWISLEKAECGGVWVEKAFLSVSRENGVFTLEKLDGVVGRGVRQGPLKAAAVLDTASGAFHGEMEGAFNPHLWKPLLLKQQMEILDWFQFGDVPPVVKLEFSGVVGDLQRFAFQGSMSATSFAYRGVGLTAGSAGLALRDGVMRLDPLDIAREEGGAHGWIELDYNRQTAAFQIDSTADPHAVARMIGPGPGRFLEDYRFEGPAHVTASGVVSYVGFSPVDVEAWVEGRGVGLGWALSDEAAFRVRASNQRVEITDIRAEAYGGRLTGRMAFYPLNKPNDLRYDAVGQLADTRFEDLMAALIRLTENPYKGRLSADFRLEGRVGEGRGRTALGEGRIRIRDGALFQIPLMGGLSEWLTRLYPGLGFASQTDFRSEFLLQDGAFHTEEALLEGSVLSLKAKGDYRLDRRIDMTVQVQPLRDGVVAEAVRLATSPLTKLLEFKLSGTIADPKWRPVNLPKEMFLIFD